jgi:hypothetical protein
MWYHKPLHYCKYQIWAPHEEIINCDYAATIFRRDDGGKTLSVKSGSREFPNIEMVFIWNGVTGGVSSKFVNLVRNSGPSPNHNVDFKLESDQVVRSIATKLL